MSVGDEFPVGGFFWIRTCIGMANNAVHGHGVRNEPQPGSADVGSMVRVLAVQKNYATVVLLRPKVPYGALAPHGTIFIVPISELRKWSPMVVEKHRRDETRASFRSDLGAVHA